MVLRDGAVGRLATLLNSENRTRQDQGTTDGQTTNLNFDYDDGDAFVKTIDGDFAGHALKLHVLRLGTTPDGVPILRFKSQGGDIDVDVTTQRVVPTGEHAATDFRETGTIDGRKVDLTYNFGKQAFGGSLGASPVQLGGQGTHQLDRPATWTGDSGPDPIRLISTPRVFHAGDFEVQTGLDVQGQWAGVAVDEHESGLPSMTF